VKQPFFALQGLQLGINPLLQNQGQFTRLVNVDSDPAGVKRKRAGYGTLLAPIAGGSSVNSLAEWHLQDGTTFWLYAASGSTLNYSYQGTGAWTIAGNGTIANGSAFNFAVINETLIGGDGVGSTRHTTNGTFFTDTVLAPIASRFTDYQNRIYCNGTASTLFYSSTGDASNWNLSGTSDSSSLTIPGPGKLIEVMKVSDRIVTIKNSGLMHRWDGDSLVDLSTKYGYTSPRSIGNTNDFRFGLTRMGYFGFNGQLPQLISTPIERQIYNDSGSAIAGGTFSTAVGICYRKQYLCSVGTVTDDFTNSTVKNALQVYNFIYDEWSNYSFGTVVSTLGTYTDISGNSQLVFGDDVGQVYQYGGTNTSDNGLPIEAVIEYVYHDGLPEVEKEFKYVWLFFNPGCQAKIQVAVGNTFTNSKKDWVDLGDVTDGVAELQFSGQRGRLLFARITESSTNARFSFYGMTCDYDPIDRN
jgi:hypothetical protein